MTMRIGALASSVSVSPKTIRYYEAVGILPAPPRSASGYRLYTSSDQMPRHRGTVQSRRRSDAGTRRAHGIIETDVGRGLEPRADVGARPVKSPAEQEFHVRVGRHP